jgi:tocopherol O-methyltransferase
MGQPSTQAELTNDIQKHYDALSSFYRLLWGPHIHHGYWEADETPAQAQVKLIERLAAKLDVSAEHRVLDVGCGLGGSSCWLAATFGCSVLGATLSPTQARMARKRAQEKGVADRVRFQVLDANELELPGETFDRVWIIECSEHIHDKPGLFANCSRVLRPGGRLGLCVWLRGETNDPAHEQLIDEICRAMLCPGLVTMRDQAELLRAAGFEDIDAEDITSRVLPTWTHCRKLVGHPLARMVINARGGKLRRFVRSFDLMEDAYRRGALAYGMISASKA